MIENGTDVQKRPCGPGRCSLGFALKPVYFAIIYPSCVWEISITAVSVVKVLVPPACGVSTCGGGIRMGGSFCGRGLVVRGRGLILVLGTSASEQTDTQ